jgi:hypothetical protein
MSVDRISVVISVLALSLAGGAAAQCTSKAVTDTILVDFPGCARVKIGNDADVVIDGVTIPVTKDGTYGNYYHGTLPRLRVIKELRISSAEAGPSRTRCDVDAAPYPLAPGGASCAAIFHVPCEPLWQVKIDSDPDPSQPTTFEFWREAPQKVTSCNGSVTIKPVRRRTPASISGLSSSETLIVRVPDSEGEPAEFPVKRAILDNGAVHLLEIEPRARSTDFSPTVAMHELKRAQARQFKDLLLQLAGAAETP